MTLATGTRLGPYEVLEPIGKGGMGEVYRARDTKLDRDVAVKVLPEEFAADEQRLARFEREAKLLASLNHPNIASIHGFEDSDGVKALVLELVEGPTLAERIEQGPIPVDEAITIAKQIAEALEAGHEAGVIHRDLKPANVKVREDGTVKVLDYGLAKALKGDTPSGSASELSQSPTKTRQGTQVGVILGTAFYMSPEQAKGKRVDRRADIWAFGAVVYEMLTGKRVFGGKDVSDTLAAVLRSEPDFDALPAETPVAVKKMVQLCLAKESKQRARDIGDVRLGLDGAFHSDLDTESTGIPSGGYGKVAIGFGLGALVAGVALLGLRSTSTSGRVVRYAIALPAETDRAFSNFTGQLRDPIAIAPGGGRVAYAFDDRIYLRELDTLNATPLPGTHGRPHSLAFSPDGAWLAFWAGGALKKIPLGGGAPIALCEHNNALGMSWEQDDKLHFGGSGGVWEVNASGGVPELVVETSEQITWNPQLLPDGRSFLFGAGSSIGSSNWNIYVKSPEDAEPRVLTENSNSAHYVPTGHIMFYGGSGQLFAVPFDSSSVTVSKTPVRVAEGSTDSFSVSRDGTLLYLAQSEASDGRLVWVDRTGSVMESLDEQPVLMRPHVAPGGRRVAVERGNPKDIWVYDLDRGTSIRVTANGSLDRDPVWMPNGERLVFSSFQAGPPSIYSRPADGTGESELLLAGGYDPYSVSPDGKTLAMYSLKSGDRDIYTLDLDNLGEPRPFLVTGFNERSPGFSPDGKFIAYASDASGQDEIYVQPYPGPGTRTIVSTDGGRVPVWSRDGTELFYRNGNRMMVVAVVTEPTFRVEIPELLFEGDYLDENSWRSGSQTFDVSADGERFLMIQRAQEPRELHVVVNWFSELERLAPVK